MQQSPSDFLAILDCLARHKVNFIIVGGVSAVLNGAPVVTMDLDIVHERSQDNIKLLMEALDELGACYRQRPDLKPGVSHLSSPGHQLLLTKAGPLDVLGAIGSDDSYPDLLNSIHQLEIQGHKLRVLNLDKLIEVKEFVGRDKDKAVLPVLRNTLKESQ